MKSRGYGLTGRTAYSNYVFDKRDVTALIYLAVTIIYFLIGALLGKIHYRYFPSMRGYVYVVLQHKHFYIVYYDLYNADNY